MKDTPSSREESEMTPSISPNSIGISKSDKGKDSVFKVVPDSKDKKGKREEQKAELREQKRAQRKAEKEAQRAAAKLAKKEQRAAEKAEAKEAKRAEPRAQKLLLKKKKIKTETEERSSKVKRESNALVLSSQQEGKLVKLELRLEEMSLVDIINDRHKGGKEAPSEIEQKKILKEQRKSGISCKSEPKPEVQSVRTTTSGADGQRAQLMLVNGKMQLVKPSIAVAPVQFRQLETSAVVDYKNRKISSLDNLRSSKKQKTRRWSSSDEEKFYDAIMVFGEDPNKVFNLLFSVEAKKNYVNPDEDFSERSIVQLRNKLKTDADQINSRIKSKKPYEDGNWFFKKYRISLPQAEAEVSSDFSSEDNENNSSMGAVDSRAS